MTNKAITKKVSVKGQLVLPSEFRKQLNINSGDEVSVSLNDNEEIVIKKVPTQLDWHNLIKDIPTETVDIDKDGHYDKTKAPNFAKWMEEG
ncbi:AbrB/MazE/SpoVT family DNA-binding domain-containing protein [Lentilactobacillus raoultii]|uniref:AbrB/MazE/SpoVT family DNA-binding domain-containing protein n=1 Tax=Lentilactobacillus raoultii TaxID=1987503 RepID=A0ABW3PJQ3_9LACO|nr:AbrB/MazE/SpoVT family DNA-binding domain-containing protein [Lentilactobacillus raoultii]